MISKFKLNDYLINDEEKELLITHGNAENCVDFVTLTITDKDKTDHKITVFAYELLIAAQACCPS